MSRILFIDLLSSNGHAEFNKIYLNALNEGNLILVAKNDYLSSFSSHHKIDRINIPRFLFINDSNYSILNRLSYFIIIHYTLIRIYKHLFNSKIIISSYDEISLALSLWFPKSILINHNNVAGLNKRIKRFFYKVLSFRHIQLVFNEEIGRHLKEHNFRSIVVPHGLPKPITKKKHSIKASFRFIFIPSQANSKNKCFVDIISSPTFLRFLERSGFKLVVKGDGTNCNPNIIFLNKYLNRQEYEFYLLESAFIILPYPKKFKYRVSGVFFECIANNKRVALSNISSFRVYEEHFLYDPFFNDAQDLTNICLNFIGESDNNNSYQNIDKLILTPKKLFNALG